MTGVLLGLQKVLASKTVLITLGRLGLIVWGLVSVNWRVGRCSLGDGVGRVDGLRLALGLLVGRLGRRCGVVGLLVGWRGCRVGDLGLAELNMDAVRLWLGSWRKDASGALLAVTAATRRGCRRRVGGLHAPSQVDGLCLRLRLERLASLLLKLGDHVLHHLAQLALDAAGHGPETACKQRVTVGCRYNVSALSLPT